MQTVDGNGDKMSLDQILSAHREMERLRNELIVIDQRIEDMEAICWQRELDGQENVAMTRLVVQLLKLKCTRSRSLKQQRNTSSQ